KHRRGWHRHTRDSGIELRWLRSRAGGGREIVHIEARGIPCGGGWPLNRHEIQGALRSTTGQRDRLDVATHLLLQEAAEGVVRVVDDVLQDARGNHAVVAATVLVALLLCCGHVAS